ncbi:hypothetical protein N0V95_007597 [Ascochyta clinopodiicola]|nr:hypothetical protein N0V95_007597 [Ascochyta clinopodiicola]
MFKMKTKHTIPLVYLTSFLFLFGETLQPAPRTAIYEAIVCQHHYASRGPGAHDCKVAPVQQELAFLGGMERLSIIIPSILAIPFAALADRSIAQLLVGNQQVLAMLILVFFCQLGYDSVPLMLAIYISKRFGWEFSDASFLSSLEMSIEFLALVVLLPALTSGLPSGFQRLPTFAKDKTFAQASLIALAIGTFCLGFAPAVSIAIIGIVVLALGTGQDSLTRSMATDMVHVSDLSTLYSAITMLRAIGGSISGPIYAWLYTAALRKDVEAWLGLPYIVAGALFVVALGLLTVVKDPARDEIKASDDAVREPLLG